MTLWQPYFGPPELWRCTYFLEASPAQPSGEIGSGEKPRSDELRIGIATIEGQQLITMPKV